MIATLLLVGVDDPDDPGHLRDVRQDLAFLPHAYPIVLLPDVDTTRAWCRENRDPVVIAYTEHTVRTWHGRPGPLVDYGDEVVLVHAPADLSMWDAAERAGAGIPIPINTPTGIAKLVKYLASATVPPR